MPGIRQLLRFDQEQVTTVEVVRKNADGTYAVKDGRREINVRSAFAEDLTVGARTVMTRTTTGNFVVGQERIIYGTITEVNIDG